MGRGIGRALNRAFALAALASAVLFTAAPANTGTIYVYAQRLTAARSWIPITCGGAVVAELKRGKLFAIELRPGRYTLAPASGTPLVVKLRSGEESFIRLDWIYDAGQRPVPVLSIMRPEQARREMKYLSYIDANKVRSGTVPKTDPRPPEPLQFKKRDGR